MGYNEKLANRIRALLGKRKGFTEKKMFGGVTFLLNGRMCCGVHKDDLIVRVGAEKYKGALGLSHTRPMDFTGRPTTGFIFVDPEGWSNDTVLRKWLGMGVDYVSTIPKKRTSTLTKKRR